MKTENEKRVPAHFSYRKRRVEKGKTARVSFKKQNGNSSSKLPCPLDVQQHCDFRAYQPSREGDRKAKPGGRARS